MVDLMGQIYKELAGGQNVNIYHFSVGGFRIQPSAKASILREGDEIKVFYEVPDAKKLKQPIKGKPYYQ